jgi:hypothetical protein
MIYQKTYGEMLKQRPQYLGGFMGGVKAMVRKEIAEFMPYKLYWAVPNSVRRGKTGFTPEFAFSVRFPLANPSRLP